VTKTKVGTFTSTVKAGNKKGKDVITFTTKSDSGDIAIKVKIR
jgi:hypothetical protein